MEEDQKQEVMLAHSVSKCWLFNTESIYLILGELDFHMHNSGGYGDTSYLTTTGGYEIKRQGLIGSLGIFFVTLSLHSAFL